MESNDCSFEDFQDSKKFPAVGKVNLRKKVLTRKRVTETAKSQSSLSKTTKRFNSSQQLSLVEHGTPVLETNKSISDTLRTKVDVLCLTNQVTTLTSHSVISNHSDNHVISHPHQNFSEDSSNLSGDVEAIPHHQNSQLHDSLAKYVSETSNHGDDDSLSHTNPEIGSQKNSIVWSNENLSNQQLTPHSNSHISSQLSDDSSHQDSPSKNTSTIWQCPMCKESIASYWRDSHFLHCLKRFEHKKGSGVHKPCLESFVCDICKLDITTFSTLARSEHVNRCLDSQIENVKPNNVPSNDAVSENSETFIGECPLCNKKSSSIQAKLAHIKKCSQAMRIEVQSVITALQLQKKHAVERVSLGLPLVPIKSLVPKTKASTIRKLIREPKSAADSDVQLAKALSLSIEDEEKRKDLQELSAFEDMELSDISLNSLQQIQLQASKNDQKRKKKPSKKPVPLLVLRTEEDRLRILQEKVSSIIIAPESPEEPLRKEEEVGKSPSSMEVDISIVNHERSCPLWNLSAKAEEKMSYYISDLLEFIAPCAIEPGSKLKSLSQIPGHRIYTQQPYDFTFNSTPHNLKEDHMELSTKSPPPSTQEMLDIIVEDPVSTANEAFSRSPILEDANTNSEKMTNHDGFLRVKNESKMFLFHDPVVSCLETLVNNTWMSDTQIAVSDGSLIPAHKLLLMLRCPGLRKDLAQDGNALLHWNNVSSEVCTNFLNFVYTGSLSWPDALTHKILSLAKRCGMKEFEELKKAFCTDGPFIEDAASQSTALSDEENSQDRNLSNRNPSFFTDDITRSEKDCSSPHDVNFPEDLRTGTGLMNSTPVFLHQQNAASHELSAISGIHEHDTGLEGCTSFNSPAKEAPKSDGMLAKYSDNATELAEIKCLESPHLNKTKLLLENSQAEERASSPELFVCDSDDDEIPANQEVVLGKSSTDKSISNHAILFPGFSHSSPNELTSCKYNGIAPNVLSSKNSCSSPFSKHCLSYSQESEQNNATAPLLHPEADTSDCCQDDEIICISENEGDLNCLSPVKEHLGDNVMTDGGSFQGNDKTVFRCSAENSDCLYNSPMKCCAQNISSAASISKLQSGNDSIPQFCEELYEFSPPREPLSPNFFMPSQSPYNSHSALLNTPVSSRRKSSRIGTLSERENCHVLFASNNSNSPSKIHSASELLSSNCFHSNLTLKRNFSDSELRHRLPNLNFDVASFKEDIPRIKLQPSFEIPSFERFVNHHTSLRHTNVEVNGISSQSVNLTMNKKTNTTGCESPICLSSDDDDLVINPSQKSHDNDKYDVNPQHNKTCDEPAITSQSDKVCNYSEPEMNPTIQRLCESPEIISSDDDVLPEYYTFPVSNQARDSPTTSPYKRDSFISASQPLKRTYDIDLDEEIPPLHVRIQRYQDEIKRKEEKELTKPAPLSVTNESDDSSGLPSISFSAPVGESRRDDLASHRGNSENGNSQSKACTPDVHKQIKHLKNAECLISDSPITPLPNYQTMVTPEIKGALKKFGIRNMPRKKAVALLSHIYDETHPIVDLSGEVVNEPGTPHHQRIASSQPCRAKLQTKKRKFASQIAQDQTENKPSKNPVAKKMKISKKSVKSSKLKNPPDATQEEMDINGVSQENDDDLACSQNSSKSDLSDMPEESYVESDEIVESQKYVNKDLVAKNIDDYIKSNTELHSKILMYEPLVLPTFQQELKDVGIKISATNLMNFLDEKCITFSVPRNEKFKKKQQQRTQKFRKRMIQKEKEQCSQACA